MSLFVEIWVSDACRGRSFWVATAMGSLTCVPRQSLFGLPRQGPVLGRFWVLGLFWVSEHLGTTEIEYVLLYGDLGGLVGCCLAEC